MVALRALNALPQKNLSGVFLIDEKRGQCIPSDRVVVFRNDVARGIKNRDDWITDGINLLGDAPDDQGFILTGIEFEKIIAGFEDTIDG